MNVATQNVRNRSKYGLTQTSWKQLMYSSNHRALMEFCRALFGVYYLLLDLLSYYCHHL